MSQNTLDRLAEEPDVYNILVVDDNGASRQLMAEILQSDGKYHVDEAVDGQAALEALKGSSYHMVISDVKMPRMDGLELLEVIRERHPDLPVIIASGFGDEISAHAFEKGADDCIYMPFRIEEFKFRVARTLRYYQLMMVRDNLVKQNHELWGRAITDRLTGLYNRQYFEEIVTTEFERAKRYRTQLGCILFDIDHFKLVNDDYGHLVGDTVLKEIGGLVMETLRRADIAARYGGEEFVIILPETTREGVFLVAERLRSAVEEHQFCEENPPENKEMRQVTISLGASHFPDERLYSSMQLVKITDEKLYQAKKEGRNKVIVAWED